MSSDGSLSGTVACLLQWYGSATGTVRFAREDRVYLRANREIASGLPLHELLGRQFAGKVADIFGQAPFRCTSVLSRKRAANYHLDKAALLQLFEPRMRGALSDTELVDHFTDGKRDASVIAAWAGISALKHQVDGAGSRRQRMPCSAVVKPMPQGDVSTLSFRAPLLVRFAHAAPPWLMRRRHKCARMLPS